jgi:hypothetical protein
MRTDEKGQLDPVAAILIPPNGLASANMAQTLYLSDVPKIPQDIYIYLGTLFLPPATN